MPLSVGDLINPPAEEVPALLRGKLLGLKEIIQDLDAERGPDRHRVKVLLKVLK